MPFVPPPTRLVRPARSRPETLADYGVFRVERATFTFEGERPAAIAGMTVACADWVNVVAVTADDEIVLVWQHRFGVDAPSVEIPGGTVDPGEDPAAAALRELEEETGYVAEAATLLTTVNPNPALHGNRCFTYAARVTGRVPPRPGPGEAVETVLVAARVVPLALDAGEITHALAVVGLETYLRRRAAGEMSITSAASIGSAS